MDQTVPPQYLPCCLRQSRILLYVNHLVEDSSPASSDFVVVWVGGNDAVADEASGAHEGRRCAVFQVQITAVCLLSPEEEEEVKTDAMKREFAVKHQRIL